MDQNMESEYRKKQKDFLKIGKKTKRDNKEKSKKRKSKANYRMSAS